MHALSPLSSYLVWPLSHHIWSQYSRWCWGGRGLCCRWRRGLRKGRWEGNHVIVIQHEAVNWSLPVWPAYCAGWWACGWRCGWCKSGPGSTGCCGRSQRLGGRRHLCTQSLPEPWWGPPRCGGSWWSQEPPQTWGERGEEEDIRI